MGKIVLVDSSVLLNILNVPGRNQRRQETLDTLKQHVDAGDRLYLPLACIIETGNHLARLSDGHDRRRLAEAFASKVTEAIENRAPWQIVPTGGSDQSDWSDLRNWLARFPDDATRGLSFTDAIIIYVYDTYCKKSRMSHVCVWALDSHLHGLDRPSSR